MTPQPTAPWRCTFCSPTHKSHRGLSLAPEEPHYYAPDVGCRWAKHPPLFREMAPPHRAPLSFQSGAFRLSVPNVLYPCDVNAPTWIRQRRFTSDVPVQIWQVLRDTSRAHLLFGWHARSEAGLTAEKEASPRRRRSLLRRHLERTGAEIARCRGPPVQTDLTVARRL